MSVINESEIKYIVIHCSATNGDVSAETINRWHKERKWKEIGYHFVIRRDGTIEIGRDLDERGAHVEGYNDDSWGICMAGGVNVDNEPEDNFTPAEYHSLKLLLRVLKLIAFNAIIKGHNEFPGVHKACPCFPVQDWLAMAGIPNA